MFAKMLSTTETSAKGISTFELGARSNLSCVASTNLAHSWPVSSHVMLSLPKHGPFVIETMIQPTPELLRVKSSSTPMFWRCRAIQHAVLWILSLGCFDPPRETNPIWGTVAISTSLVKPWKGPATLQWLTIRCIISFNLMSHGTNFSTWSAQQDL